MAVNKRHYVTGGNNGVISVFCLRTNRVLAIFHNEAKENGKCATRFFKLYSALLSDEYSSRCYNTCLKIYPFEPCGED